MFRLSVVGATVVTAAALCALPSVASAIDPFDPDTQAETLLSRAIIGAAPLEAAGDVNGDGHDDVIFQDIDFEDDDEGIAARVAFGPLPPGEPTTAQLMQKGFSVLDPPDFFNRFPEVEGIGDVNGDGKDDVLVAADAEKRTATVIFGSTSTAPANAEAPSSRGFLVTDVDQSPTEGTTGLGDLNGDGKDDFAVVRGASVAVVFGKATTTPVSAATPGAQGYVVQTPGSFFGTTVGGGMDFNGDGRGDLVVNAGFDKAWVVYGKATTTPVDLSAPGAAAVSITAASGQQVRAVSEAGDVNGDGRGDVIVGMSDRAVVVYGRASNAPINGASLGTGGFTLRNGTTATFVPWVKAAGDVNLDGFDDVLVTASGAPLENGYVIYGKAGTTAVNLLALGVRGYKVIRRNRLEGVGNVVADERPDIGGPGFAMSPPHDDLNGDCTIRGTASANVINGTAGNDVICGLGGNDTINGLGGDDLIVGGDGDDRLNGGDANDRLVGGLGTDTIKGDAGVDRISGGTGNDPLDGGAGDDFLSGGDGLDTVHGGLDDDRLLGFEGVDKLYGDAGEDSLDGEGAGDTVDGGADADFATGGAATDTVLGGLGNDVLRGDQESVSPTGDARDTMRGGDGNDDMNGDWGNDLMYGDAGNDTVNGWDGTDSLRGGIGDDTLIGLTGADTLIGEAGNDTLDSSLDATKDANTCGAGLDTVTYDLGLDTFSADCETRNGV